MNNQTRITEGELDDAGDDLKRALAWGLLLGIPATLAVDKFLELATGAEDAQFQPQEWWLYPVMYICLSFSIFVQKLKYLRDSRKKMSRSAT